MTIDDLVFEPHPSGAGGHRAAVFFPNGYGASVISGGPFFTDNGTYEIAVLVGNESSFSLTYDTPIADDVLAYLSEDKANQALCDIEALPPVEIEAA